jgi:hypothetical protein
MGNLGRLKRRLVVPACLLVPGVCAVGLSVWAVSGVGAEPIRVRQTLDVEGQIFAPAGRGAEPVRRPITVTGRFDFVEEPAPKGQASSEAKGQASSGREPAAAKEQASSEAKGQASSGREPANSPAKSLVVRRYLDAVADLKIGGVRALSTATTAPLPPLGPQVKQSPPQLRALELVN